MTAMTLRDFTRDEVAKVRMMSGGHDDPEGRLTREVLARSLMGWDA